MFSECLKAIIIVGILNRKWTLVALVLGLSLTNGLMAKPSSTVSGETPRSYYQLLFLFDKTTAPGQSEYSFHPLFSTYGNAERAYSFTSILYPIFYTHGTDQWRKSTFLYFITFDDFFHDDSGSDEDILLTPLLYWGMGDSDKERYFSIFPLAGRIKNKLSYSEIHYFMFPLYSGWSYREYSADSVLWPIFMYGSSTTRSEFRFFPFFSRKVHEGKYERYTVMWPFFQYSNEALDQKEPRHTLFLFPFYGRKWSDQGKLSSHTILWPLFSWGSDTQTDGFDLNLFWFIFQYGRNSDPYLKKLIIFPFYGTYAFGSKNAPKDPDQIYSNQFSFITPFFAQSRTNSAILESRDYYLIPFFMTNNTYYRKERESEDYIKVWPLFQASTSTAGTFSFRTLVLWPFRSDNFERNWGPFYSLFQYDRYENQDRYLSVAFRLYSRYWNDSEEHHFIAGFNIDHTPEVTGVEFLGGLLGFERRYTRMEKKENILRLFWLSI